jgi:hypothetical protein
VCVALLLNSILRGIRTPGGWAATSLLINYDFGFSRRALLGAIISWLHAPILYTYVFAFWFSVVIFAANVCALLRLLMRVFAVGSTDAKLSALVFTSSFGVVLLAHCIGYSEQIPLLVTLIALQIDGFYARASFVAALFPACLLIHETALPMFLPVICFRFLADLADQSDQRKVYTACALFIFLATLGLTIGMFRLSKPLALDMYHSLQSKADFPLRPDEFVWLMRSSLDSMRLALRFYTDNAYFRRLLIYSLIVTLPSTLYLLARSMKLLRARGYPAVMCWLAGLSSTSPLLLDVVGVGDTARYNSMGTTVSFLVFSTTLLYFRPRINREPATEAQFAWLIPAMLVMLNLGSTIRLFDYYVVQGFPYEQHVDDVTKMLTGQQAFPPRPITDWYQQASIINDYNGD